MLKSSVRRVGWKYRFDEACEDVEWQDLTIVKETVPSQTTQGTQAG